MEDELTAKLARVEGAEERKTHYKHLARQFYYEMKSKLEVQEGEFD